MTLDKQTQCSPNPFGASAILLSQRQLPHPLSRENPQRTARARVPRGHQPDTEFDLGLNALVKMGTRQRLQQRLQWPPHGDSYSNSRPRFCTLSTMCPYESTESVQQRGCMPGRFYPGSHHGFVTYQPCALGKLLNHNMPQSLLNKMEITGFTTYSCKD